MFMFINRKLSPSPPVREDALPFSLVWDTSQRHQGTKRIHGEIKMSLGVLRRYFLQKKLSRKLMIFQGLSPTQHNMGQGLVSSRAVPARCVWDDLQGSVTGRDK